MTIERKNSTTDKEPKLVIHSVISADMAEQAKLRLLESGRISNENARERLARNLGKILEDRKGAIKSLSELVVNAGVSENSDASRLGRFRIRPGKAAARNTKKRLSENPKHYLSLIRAISKETGDDENELILEFVAGTSFENNVGAEQSVEPIRRLHSILKRKVALLSIEYDLADYFKKIARIGAEPIWGTGPLCEGKRTGRHAYGKSPLLGWKRLSRRIEDAMICIPLCRVRKGESTLHARVSFGDHHNIDRNLETWERFYLCIGMMTRTSIKTEEGVPIISQVDDSDKSPQMYLIAVDEFHDETAVDEFPSAWEVGQFKPITGCMVPEYAGYDIDREHDVTIEELDGYGPMHPPPSISMTPVEYGCGDKRHLERIYRLDFLTFRKLFKEDVRTIKRLEDDLLNPTHGKLTHFRDDSIAACLEANLITPAEGEHDGSRAISAGTVLDALEEEVSRMTSSFRDWLSQEEGQLENSLTRIENEINNQLDLVESAKEQDQ